MTIDTNILIAYLAGEDKVVKQLTSMKESGITIFLSAIVETEVLSFKDWEVGERLIVEKFLEENFTLITIDRTIARLTAKIRRETKIKFPDGAIAATAIFTRTPLITRNLKDFKQVKDLKIISI